MLRLRGKVILAYCADIFPLGIKTSLNPCVVNKAVVDVHFVVYVLKLASTILVPSVLIFYGYFCVTVFYHQ